MSVDDTYRHPVDCMTCSGNLKPKPMSIVKSVILSMFLPSPPFSRNVDRIGATSEKTKSGSRAEGRLYIPLAIRSVWLISSPMNRSSVPTMVPSIVMKHSPCIFFVTRRRTQMLVCQFLASFRTIIIICLPAHRPQAHPRSCRP